MGQKWLNAYFRHIESRGVMFRCHCYSESSEFESRTEKNVTTHSTVTTGELLGFKITLWETVG
jgi:hypothetical protein